MTSTHVDRMPRRALEGVLAAVRALRSHSLRAALTAFGVMIGVASVIAVVSLIEGFGDSVSAQFKGLGTNSIVLYANPSTEQRIRGSYRKITEADLQAIEHDVPHLSHVTPVLSLGQFSEQVRYRGGVSSTTLYGTTPGFAESGQYYPVVGRFISHLDEISHRRVCVIGDSVAQDVGLPAMPVGQFIRLKGEDFRVVGVLNKRGNLAGLDQDNLVVIPFGTAHSIIGAATEPNIQIRMTVDDVSRVASTADLVARLMRARHRLAPGERDDFKVQTASQLASSITHLFDEVSLILAAIVGISLFVAGVGIMNIMLVSVTERTREIGICKSLGAERTDILLQFLTESVLICLMGCAIGVLVGFAAAHVIALAVPAFSSVHMPLWAVLISVGCSTATGVVFGIAPAVRAASLDPIEALRFE